jgi:hypothetical protein
MVSSNSITITSHNQTQWCFNNTNNRSRMIRLPNQTQWFSWASKTRKVRRALASHKIASLLKVTVPVAISSLKIR